MRPDDDQQLEAGTSRRFGGSRLRPRTPAPDAQTPEVLDADDPRPSRRVGIEELIRANPDVVIDFSATDSGATADRADTERLMEPWRALATVAAVRNGRVHFITDPHLAVPGPAMGVTADHFRTILRGGARAHE